MRHLGGPAPPDAPAAVGLSPVPRPRNPTLGTHPRKPALPSTAAPPGTPASADLCSGCADFFAGGQEQVAESASRWDVWPSCGCLPPSLPGGAAPQLGSGAAEPSQATAPCLQVGGHEQQGLTADASSRPPVGTASPPHHLPAAVLCRGQAISVDRLARGWLWCAQVWVGRPQQLPWPS